MGKFIRKSKLDPEPRVPSREYRTADRYESEDDDLEAIEQQIAALEAKRRTFAERSDQRMDKRSSRRVDEDYFENAVEYHGQKYPASARKYMRDLPSVEDEAEFQGRLASLNGRRVNRDEYAGEDDYARDPMLYYQAGTQRGLNTLFGGAKEIIEDVLMEKVEATKLKIKNQMQRELAEHSRGEDRQSRERYATKFLDVDALDGATASDLRSGRIRATGYEEEMASGFGQVDESRLKKVEEARERMKNAKVNRDKAIKSNHVVDPDEVRMWEDMEYQKSRSVKDIYNNDMIRQHLEGKI